MKPSSKAKALEGVLEFIGFRVSGLGFKFHSGTAVSKVHLWRPALFRFSLAGAQAFGLGS